MEENNNNNQDDSGKNIIINNDFPNLTSPGVYDDSTQDIGKQQTNDIVDTSQFAKSHLPKISQSSKLKAKKSIISKNL